MEDTIENILMWLMYGMLAFLALLAGGFVLWCFVNFWYILPILSLITLVGLAVDKMGWVE